MSACALCRVWLFATPWTVAHQAPLSMEFSRKEYWSRLPFSSPGDLPEPRIKPASPVSPALAGRSVPLCPQQRGYWKGVAEPQKKPGFWPLEVKSSSQGQRQGLITQSFCAIEFLKYKRDRESFWHRHQKGQKEYTLASVSNRVLYSPISYYSESKECLEVVKNSLDLLP